MPEADSPRAADRPRVRSSNSDMLRRTLLWSGLFTLAIAAAGSLVGFLVAGAEGVYSALLGAVLAALFLGLTAVIMLIAARYHQPENISIYFGIVLGGWALKIVLFLVGLIMLRGQEWIHGYVFFFCVLASVIASLVIDMVVMAKTRVTYASHVGSGGGSAVAATPAERVAESPQAP